MMFLSQTGTPPKTVLVTSPLPGEGKTTVASNLAIALAKYGSTCLVDADMRMPTVGPSFHVTQKLGLEQYLQGTATLDQILCPSRDINNLAIIPSPMPAEFANYLLTGKPIKFLIKQLRERFDFVVIDTPPIIPYGGWGYPRRPRRANFPWSDIARYGVARGSQICSDPDCCVERCGWSK
jgi:capsular exopolysaccharide synthesis family protein